MRARISALLAVALVGLAAMTPQAHSAHGAVTPTYGEASGIHPPANGCGVLDLAKVNAALARTAQLGASMIRCDLSWWIVQPTKTTWDWSIYDNVVAAAATNHLKVMFIPQFTPPWARPNPLPAGTTNASHVPPVKMSDYVNFVRHAANRYAPTGTQRPAGLVGSVSMWEIWNEQNLVDFWNPVSPARYGTMLKNSSVAIKKIDPNAQIISGGFAPANNTNGNIAPDTFLDALGQAGTLKFADGYGMHPYSFPAFPRETIAWNPITNQVPRMYAVISKYGQSSKKIWATEVGWPTSWLSNQTVRWWDNNLQVGTEYWQTFALLDLYKTWYSAPYAGPLFLYAFRDKCVDATSWWCSMGLERFDTTRKPAYDAVHTILPMPVGSL